MAQSAREREANAEERRAVFAQLERLGEALKEQQTLTSRLQARAGWLEGPMRSGSRVGGMVESWSSDGRAGDSLYRCSRTQTCAPRPTTYTT